MFQTSSPGSGQLNGRSFQGDDARRSVRWRRLDIGGIEGRIDDLCLH